MNQIHAYMFVYDSSNKKTFDSMKCMLETIMELEKSRKKGAGAKGAGGKKKGGGAGAGEFYPKKIIVGNKRDLKKNKEAGSISKEDIEGLQGIKIKEISALTNQGIQEVFKILIDELHKDKELAKIQEDYFKKLALLAKGEDDNKEEPDNAKKNEDGIKQPGVDSGGGGFWSCCGARKEEEVDDDSDNQKEESSEDE